MNSHLHEGPAGEGSAPAPRSRRPLRLLLLEDSRFDAELLVEALAAQWPEAHPTVVRDEESFIHALADGGWDIVLSDYELPGFTGAQALEVVRSFSPRLPFIFVSGVIGEDNAVELLKRGATDYVSKGRLSRLPVVLDRALREVADREAREAAESRLREADTVFGRVVDSLRDHAVILLDTQARITTWSRAAHEMFGYGSDEAIGAQLDMLLTQEERERGVIKDELHTAVASGKASSQRWKMRKDGTRVWTEGALSPLYTDAGKLSGFCMIARDTTAEHEAAETLRRAKEQAEAAREETERASRAKDRFLAVLSHELRNPLSPISFATHLLEKTAAVPEKYKDLLPMIRRNVALEARLIDDLLDLTTITSGKLSLKPAPVEMNDLVRDAADMVAESLAQNDLHLDLQLGEPAVTVRADAARIQQVVSNLLRNAIKFSHKGGRIRLQTGTENGGFVLRCSDEGIGIPAEALQRIFTAFEQADREVARRLGGLGLGLAIARHLVTEHGGELTAHSEGRDRGATFVLRLPCISHEDVPALAPTVQEAAATAAMATMSANDEVDPRRAVAGAGPGPESGQGHRLLLVEDNIQAAQTLVLFLEDYGYRVAHAASVAEAMRLADAERFDVVLTDLGLPDGTGIEIGRALSPAMPVVALSGYGAAIDLQRTAAAGFSGHLVKPADPEEVHATLQKVLTTRSARQAA